MRRSLALASIVLVLVGVPLGVFLAARNTAPPVHPVSVTATERQIRAQLRRMGAKDIQCQVEDHGRSVACSGQGKGSSSNTIFGLGSVDTP
jgi:uncharacterized protein YneF (UPF0154 family)